MDPNNPVVKLCLEGMKAEAEGRPDEAHRLFVRAWEERQDDFDACVAAHYVARHQKTPEEALRWNQESLDRAEAVNDERTDGFYPSLYLNMGKAHEDLGNREEAKRFYELAAAKTNQLAEGRYGDTVRDGIARGLKRVSGSANS
jgi:tetratricopeptide (TPR) repeat protein